MAANNNAEAEHKPPLPLPVPETGGTINLAPIAPGNFDRAWNDPPMFDPRVNVMARPLPNKLNKRVAHPITSPVNPVTTSSTSGAPNSIGQVLPPQPQAYSVGPPPLPGHPPPQPSFTTNMPPT